MTLRRAAVIAGFAYLLNPVIYAEVMYSRLVIAGDVEQTAANILARPGLCLAVFFCYLLSFVGDIVIAWALYELLKPVNRALSQLAALFQLVYAAVALVATMSLLTAFRALTSPTDLAALGAPALHGQVYVLLDAFRSGWGMSMLLFGTHLVLVGYLIVRSRYIPWVIGVWLVLDALAWMLDSVQPYLFADASLGFLMVVKIGELALELWLLIRGWKIRDPDGLRGAHAAPL